MIARRYSPPPPDPYPLPSVRLVILCVSVAVALSMAVVILLIDVRPPPLSDIFLSPVYFPLGQQLQAKTKRWSKSEKSCTNYGVPNLNLNLSETLCGQAVWQSTAEHEEGDRYVNKIDTVYRFLQNSSVASKYFELYWSSGNMPLNNDLYSTENSNAPRSGDEFKALKWDPGALYSSENGSLLSPLNEKACGGKSCLSVFKHTIYLFRYNNVIGRLIIHGFNKSKDPRLCVEFAGRLAGIMVNLIAQNQPSSLDAFIINFQSAVRFLTRTLPLNILNKGYLAVFLLGQGVIALFDSESWIVIVEVMINQIRLLWQHLIDASVKDLYFLAVAALLFFVHQTQLFLTPYDKMNIIQTKCRSVLVLSIEKTRRQTIAASAVSKDDFLLQS